MAVEYMVLGPLEIRDGRARQALRGRRAALLAALLARAPEAVSAGRLESILWDGTAPRTAAHAVQVYVSELRKLVGADAIERHGEGYRLERGAGRVDARLFEELVAEARRELGDDRPERSLALLDSALGLWRGDAYEGLTGDDAVAADAERLAELRLAALEDRAEAALRLGGHGQVVAELESLCQAHPRRERLRAHLMLALYRSGRQPEALERCRAGRELLAREGLDPSPLLRDLERAMLRHEGTLLLPRPGAAETRLPPSPTSFVGRGPELLELRNLLRSRDVRMLTLTGPPGIGKTRLALEAARALASDYPDGVVLAELAPLRSASLVATTIGHAAGGADDAVAAIGARDLLLVVDNFEHVLEAAPLVGELLRRCRRLDVLATSRERLRVQSEHVYDVPALRIDESVALFRERACAAGRPGGNGVRDLCAHLEGLPLAIELAAAHADALPLRRIDLRNVSCDADPRHATLRATIRWSFDRLGPEEQRAFARLAVFHGGCTTGAAAAVAGAESQVLESLLDKSLLRLVDGRWTQLETVREFAAEQLDATGETDALRERHARRYAELVEAAEPELRGARQREWLDRLDSETPNVREALRWLGDAGETPRVRRLACALAPYWQARGRWEEGRRLLDGALEEPALSGTHADALGLAGRLAWYTGDRPAARVLLERSLELAEQLDDTRRQALALGRLSWVAAESDGEHALAGSLARRAVALAREADDERLLAEVLNDAVGALSSDPDGDHLLAQELGDEALALWRRLRDPQNVVEALNNLGWVALVLGESAEAEALLAESLELARGLGDVRHEILAAGNLALVRLLDGDVDAAEEQLRERLDHARELHDARCACESLRALAGVAAARGLDERAARLWGAAEAVYSPELTPPERAIHRRWIEPLTAGRTFRRERAAGAALHLDEAVELALR